MLVKTPPGTPPPTFLDKVISYLSPSWARSRERERALQTLERRGILKMSRSYRRGTTVGRLSTTQHVPAGSADFHTDSQYDREDAMLHGRDLERNNPIARALLERDVDNVVGTGPTPNALTSSEAWNKRAEELFQEWATDPLACDIQGTRDFSQLVQQVWRSARRDGDCGAIKLEAGQLQLIESEYLATPIGRENDRLVVGGVQMDSSRRPLFYHIVDMSDLDPKRLAANPRNLPKRIPIAAEDFLFLAHRDSYSQVRGVGGFARNAPYFEQLDAYIEASIMAARMAAVFGVVIKKGIGSFDTSGLSSTTGGDGNDYKSWSLEPGMVKVLDATDELSQITPEQPGFQIEPLVRTLVRMTGLEWGMPLEIAWLDFSQTNYSSARASLLQAYLAWARGLGLLNSSFLRGVWNWKIDQFIRAGKLRFRADRYRHDWQGVGRGWVDPMKEVVADLIAIDGGLGSITQVLKKRGLRLEQIVAQRGSERTLFDAAGVPLMHSNSTRDDAERLADLKPDPAPPPNNGDGKDGSKDDEPEDDDTADEGDDDA